MLENIDIAKYTDLAVSGTLSYAPKLLWAIFVFWLGFKLVNIAGKVLDRALKIKKIDPTVEKFVVNLLKNILKWLVIVAVIGMLWVETTSFVAVFAAMGLAIGMALSGTLGHFASGIMILLFKPYKVWDLVDINGYYGNITEVQIFNTIIQTRDARIVIIPNSDAISGAVINYNMVGKKRIEMTVGISYSDSIDKAREVMHKVADDSDYVLHDEWVVIAVKELWDNAVVFAFRVWVKSDDHRRAFFQLNEDVKKAFDATNGELNFPFPQRDVHLYQAK